MGTAQSGLKWAPPKGGDSLRKKVELIEPTILFFLSLYIRPDHLLIQPNRENKIPSGPKMIPCKTSALSEANTANLNDPLFFDTWEPNDACIRTWSDLNFACCPLKASLSLNLERFNTGGLSHFSEFVNSRKCQTLRVPRQSRGFTLRKLVRLAAERKRIWNEMMKEDCPSCRLGKLEYRLWRTGLVLRCSRYPAYGYARDLDRKIRF